MAAAKPSKPQTQEVKQVNPDEAAKKVQEKSKEKSKEKSYELKSGSIREDN